MQSTYEWCNDDSDDQGYDICPRWHCDILLDHNDETKNKAKDENGHIPPPWDLLVVLCHVYVVSVIIFAGSGAFVGTLDVTTPEQNSVSDESADLSTRLALLLDARSKISFGLTAAFAMNKP
jgi:hypothetical protein